ncbi:MAG: putative toxin-antitoxin system toxin component, PIN family [Longimicrobiaceae bacterium]
MRVFLDTNVLVSAYATRGLCADVLRLVLTRHELVTAEVVLGELDRILRGKMRLPADVVQEIIAYLRQYPVESRPERTGKISVRDADDAWVLASAIQVGAEVLVTGDRDLLDVAVQVEELRIMDPRGFWELHRSA